MSIIATNKEAYDIVFKDAVLNNDVALANHLLCTGKGTFENWTKEDVAPWMVSVEGWGTPLFNSTAQWIIKETKGVVGSENALSQAQAVVEHYKELEVKIKKLMDAEHAKPKRSAIVKGAGK